MISITQMLCIIFGHKYKLYFRYNISADYKCERCNGITKSFNIPSNYKKVRHYIKVSNGNMYKKIYPSWNITDYRFSDSLRNIKRSVRIEGKKN
jgi:hypothetical protein